MGLGVGRPVMSSVVGQGTPLTTRRDLALTAVTKDILNLRKSVRGGGGVDSYYFSHKFGNNG